MTLEECLDIVMGWSYSVEQEFCVSDDEYARAARERDDVVAFIRGLAASPTGIDGVIPLVVPEGVVMKPANLAEAASSPAQSAPQR
jgi:hypothetical protein